MRIVGHTATARGVHYQGRVFDLSFDAHTMSLSLNGGVQLYLLGGMSVSDAAGAMHRVKVGGSISLPVGKVDVRVVA